MYEHLFFKKVLFKYQVFGWRCELKWDLQWLKSLQHDIETVSKNFLIPEDVKQWLSYFYHINFVNCALKSKVLALENDVIVAPPNSPFPSVANKYCIKLFVQKKGLAVLYSNIYCVQFKDKIYIHTGIKIIQLHIRRWCFIICNQPTILVTITRIIIFILFITTPRLP